jgi:hypothetical protein
MLRDFGWAAAAGALLLSALPAHVNAATIDVIDDSGAFIGNNVTNNNSSQVSDLASGSGALVFTIDWIEFTVVPDSAGSVQVTVLAAPFTNNSVASYQSEYWQLVQVTDNGSLVQSPLAVTLSGSSAIVSLLEGVDYFLELQSPGPPLGDTGNSPVSIAVQNSNQPATPLPGAIGLFAGGLGLLGFTSLRRTRKTARGSTSIASA